LLAPLAQHSHFLTHIYARKQLSGVRTTEFEVCLRSWNKLWGLGHQGQLVLC